MADSAFKQLLRGAGRQIRPGNALRREGVARGIYGLVLTASVIAAVSEEPGNVAGKIAAYTLVTLVVFWIAHGYSEVLAAWIEDHEAPTWRRTAELLGREWAIVGTGIPPLLVLVVLGVLRGGSDTGAVNAALGLCLFELALASGIAARRGGARPVGVALAVLVGAAFGLVCISLKTLIH